MSNKWKWLCLVILIFSIFTYAVINDYDKYEQKRLFSTGKAEFNEGKFQAASKTFEMFLARHPAKSESKEASLLLLFSTGKIELEEGKFQAASKTFKNFITKYPDAPESKEATLLIDKAIQADIEKDKIALEEYQRANAKKKLSDTCEQYAAYARAAIGNRYKSVPLDKSLNAIPDDLSPEGKAVLNSIVKSAYSMPIIPVSEGGEDYAKSVHASNAYDMCMGRK